MSAYEFSSPEPESEPKRRRWFQFRLSSLLVVTVVFGAFVGLNLIRTQYPLLSGGPSGLRTTTLFERGWPCVINTVSVLNDNEYVDGSTRALRNFNGNLEIEPFDVRLMKLSRNPISGTWHITGILLNAFVALSIAVFIAVPFEMRTRPNDAK